MFAVDHDDEKGLPDGITSTQIPEAVYAIFRTPLVEVDQFATAIKGTWRYILEDWFPHSSYEVDEEASTLNFMMSIAIIGILKKSIWKSIFRSKKNLESDSITLEIF